MMKTGRPTLYTDDVARQARRAHELGYTDAQVADLIGVHPDTLRRWRLHHPDFAAAQQVGRYRRQSPRRAVAVRARYRL